MKLKAELIGKDMYSQELNRVLVICEENIEVFKEYKYDFLFEVELPKKESKPRVKKSDKNK